MQAAVIKAGWAFRDHPRHVELEAECALAIVAYRNACLGLMVTPAWNRKGLAWKLQQIEFMTGHFERWWRRVLEKDKARLAGRAKRPDRARQVSRRQAIEPTAS